MFAGARDTSAGFASAQRARGRYAAGCRDLTGEIGRYAAAAATRRDAAAVREWDRIELATDIAAVLELLGSLPAGNKLSKKLDALHGSVRKLETILYELSLAKASPVGKRPARPQSTPQGGEGRRARAERRTRPSDDPSAPRAVR